MARKKESFLTVPLMHLLFYAARPACSISFIFQLLIERVGDVVTLDK